MEHVALDVSTSTLPRGVTYLRYDALRDASTEPVGAIPQPPTLSREVTGGWPPRSDLRCLHCTLPIGGVPLPAVVHFDAARARYTVCGMFCRGCCALGYWQARGGPEAPMLMAHTRAMLRAYFGVVVCAPAPPHALLREYGGPLTPAQFYGEDGELAAPPTLISPPLITHAHVVAVRLREKARGPSMSCDATAALTTPAAATSTCAVEDASADTSFEGADRARVRGLRRPLTRRTPWIQGQPTGREPLLLRAIAELGGAPVDADFDDAAARADEEEEEDGTAGVLEDDLAHVQLRQVSLPAAAATASLGKTLPAGHGRAQKGAQQPSRKRERPSEHARKHVRFSGDAAEEGSEPRTSAPLPVARSVPPVALPAHMEGVMASRAPAHARAGAEAARSAAAIAAFARAAAVAAGEAAKSTRKPAEAAVGSDDAAAAAEAPRRTGVLRFLRKPPRSLT